MRLWCAMAVGAVLAASGCAHRWPATPTAALSCRGLQRPASPLPGWITLPGNSRTSALLSRWCETVGPVFFKPDPGAAAPDAVDRLAIISWNIHEGRGDVRGLIRRLRLGEFTHGEPPDQFVLLLQEATRRDDSVPARVPPGYPTPHRIAGRSGSPDGDVVPLADEGFAVLYAPSMRNGEHGGMGEDRGNAIVSTLSLTDPELIELPLERQRRVAVVAAIEGRSRSGTRWRLGVVDAHLDTALALGRGGPFAARRRQATALIDALRLSPTFRGGSAAVLAGDFNTWMGRREPAFSLLHQEFPNATISADAPPTWTGPLGLHATLDHIFVRGPFVPGPVTRLPGRFGSDHYPLLTVVRFTE